MGILKILPIILIVFISGCAAQYQPRETTVTPQYSFESGEYPTSVKAGEEFTISWKINTDVPTTIKHTAVHYSTKSNPGQYGFDITPDASDYGSLTSDYASGNFTIPNTFSVKIKATEPGKLYYRLHAIIDGRNYWTTEYMIDVKRVAMQDTLQGEVAAPSQQEQTTPPPTPPPSLSTTKEFIIDADDSAFYIDDKDITSVTVPKGNVVKITFKVREAGTYFGGLDFRGCGQDTPDTKPGASTEMQFTADSTCTIVSYWPASNRVKDSMQVVVS